MNIHDIPAFPADLVSVGRNILSRARAAAMVTVAEEFKKAAFEAQALLVAGPPREEIPESLQRLGCEAITNDSVCWEALQDHLTLRTAQHLAEVQLADNVSGASLADFLAIDLESFAREGWAPLTQGSRKPAGETL